MKRFEKDSYRELETKKAIEKSESHLKYIVTLLEIQNELLKVLIERGK